MMFAALWSHSAIKDGALRPQIYGCVEEQHAERLETIADRALIRAIQKYYFTEKDGPGMNNLRGAIAYVGVRILYSREERRNLVWMNLKSTPLCPPRG